MIKSIIAIALACIVTACGVSKNDGKLSSQEASQSGRGLYKRVSLEGISDAAYSATVSMPLERCHEAIQTTYHLTENSRMLVFVERISSETGEYCPSETTQQLLNFTSYNITSATLFIPLDAKVEQIQ